VDRGELGRLRLTALGDRFRVGRERALCDGAGDLWKSTSELDFPEKYCVDLLLEIELERAAAIAHDGAVNYRPGFVVL
jgi:hypothetical protein